MQNEALEQNIQKNLVEAALFMATKPLQLDELIRITGMGSLGYLKGVIKNLQEEYVERGLEIVDTPEGLQMKVKKEYLPRVANLTPHSDLSEGHKKTLGLVIYKEPLKQSDLVKVQGTKVYFYVKDLEKKGLIRSERSGHTKILKATANLENYFGETKEEIKKRIINSLEAGFEEKKEADAAEPVSADLKESAEEKPNEGTKQVSRPVSTKVAKKASKKEPKEEVKLTVLPHLKELSVDDLIDADGD